MISANTFSRHVSVWAQVAPMLEPVVRWANGHETFLASPVASLSQSSRNSLIAETAFQVAKAGLVSPGGTGALQAEATARNFLSALPRGAAAGTQLSPGEWREVGELTVAIQRYTAHLTSPEFGPVIPGCGVVDTAIADVLAGEELIEIKAVARPFRSSDLRQALTYTAMLYAAGKRVVQVTLLNPRRGRYVTLSLDHVAAGASGTSPSELMQDLVGWMSGLQVSA